VGEETHWFLCTILQGAQRFPAILTCSLSIAASFFTCGKKTTCEGTGRRQGHEGLEEPLVLDPREISRLTVDPW
jgi:hypothetical protein